MVLINDRTDITPAVLEMIQAEIIEVISRHVDVDPDSVRIDVEHEGRSQRLIADIPIEECAAPPGWIAYARSVLAAL